MQGCKDYRHCIVADLERRIKNEADTDTGGIIYIVDEIPPTRYGGDAARERRGAYGVLAEDLTEGIAACIKKTEKGR